MPNVGPLEIAIVLIIALIVFGPKRLPELGKSLGRGITEFKDGLSNVGSDNDPDDEDEEEDEQDAPAELTPPGAEPEVTEIINEANDTKADKDEPVEPVESEVVPERQD